MSLLRYTVTVQFDVDATDTSRIHEKLVDLGVVGDIIETKAKAIKAPKVEHE